MLGHRIFRNVMLAGAILLIASGPAIAADTEVSGTVTVAGAPLGGGKILLHLGDGEFLGTSVSKTGMYAFKKLSVPPGQYTVTIEGKGVAAKYSDEKVSALRIEVRDGTNTFDLALN